MGPRVLAAVIVGVLLLAPGTAQSPETAPTVEVEDATFPGLVVPLEDEPETEIQVRVGCEAGEPPGTITELRLRAGVPGWANVIVTPSSMTWQTAPGDCPSTEPPFRGNATVMVSLTQNAPAYETTALGLEATVVKQPAGEAANRTYGPHQANVSLTPGYFHLHDARFLRSSAQVGPWGQASLEGTVESFANHETRFTVAAGETPEDLAVAIEPAALTLAPNETGSFDVHVEAEGLSLVDSRIVELPVTVEGESTHPDGGEGGTSVKTLLVQLEPLSPDLRDVPSLGPALAAAATALVALLHRRGGE